MQTATSKVMNNQASVSGENRYIKSTYDGITTRLLLSAMELHVALGLKTLLNSELYVVIFD